MLIIVTNMGPHGVVFRQQLLWQQIQLHKFDLFADNFIPQHAAVGSMISKLQGVACTMA